MHLGQYYVHYRSSIMQCSLEIDDDLVNVEPFICSYLPIMRRILIT
uniref:DnaJ subfamily C member 8 n=1 Tax=Arundo donax TaxID=35708 RepID=A0A0A9IY45_ARUDO